jgi:hypothetical protein
MCVTNYHSMKTYNGVEVYPQVFLTSALEIGEWLASRRRPPYALFPHIFMPSELLNFDYRST